MNEWIGELAKLTAAGEHVVTVTVCRVRGSAPREVGAKMIVTATATLGTIGGGQLEYQCTRVACGMLGNDETRVTRSFPLGASMGQCCGGVVDILFEPIAGSTPAWLREVMALHERRETALICTAPGSARQKYVIAAGSDSGQQAYYEEGCLFEPVVGSDFNIAVFGAGHVGSAVVRSLAALDCNIRWIDNRRNVFGQAPANVRTIESATPALEVAAMPGQSCFLVMTHSHALDFEICDRVLRRDDAIYCGLIGSRTKRRRFEKRFRAQNMPQDVIDDLVCPIGVGGISGKKPAEIAVAVAAEVLRAYERFAVAAITVYPDNVHPLKK